MWKPPANATMVTVVTLCLLGAGCGAPRSSDDDVIGSEAVPLIGGGLVGGRDDGSTATADDPDADLSDAEPSPEDGDSGGAEPNGGEPPTELSTDPNVVYPPDTCYQPPSPGLVAEVVDCGQPHTVEVYAVRDLPGADGAPFLGLDDAIELCNQDFQRITGVGIGLATVFRRSVLRPSEETWADGERQVTCFVVYPELTDQRLSELDPVRAFGQVSLYGLDAGDCFVDFDDQATTFTPVDCREPHDAEVFVDEELPSGPYPGEEVLDERVDELCFGAAFEEFVGVDYASSAVFSLRSRPSEVTWSEGDRTINCILTDETIRTDSFQGSNL